MKLRFNGMTNESKIAWDLFELYKKRSCLDNWQINQIKLERKLGTLLNYTSRDMGYVFFRIGESVLVDLGYE